MTASEGNNDDSISSIYHKYEPQMCCVFIIKTEERFAEPRYRTALEGSKSAACSQIAHSSWTL